MMDHKNVKLMQLMYFYRNHLNQQLPNVDLGEFPTLNHELPLKIDIKQIKLTCTSGRLGYEK